MHINISYEEMKKMSWHYDACERIVESSMEKTPRNPIFRHWSVLGPGVALAIAIGTVSMALAAVETQLFGHPVIEGLVLAIILGVVVRNVWAIPDRAEAGIEFSAKQILEVAVCLLGASVNLPLLLEAGPALAIGIVLLVIVGIAASYGIGRVFGLEPKLAVLVACGNSICGNSAIAAIAPVIGARREHVASSIAFTAILGVVVVIGLPFLIGPLAFTHYQYGVLTGLSVYAVPQVLAAAFPVSVLSGQVGTLVKLVRVLMLGPVVLFFAIRNRHTMDAPRENTWYAAITRYVPWFIVGFLVLAGLRSVGAIPLALIEPTRALSTWFTVVAMAALGLGVDVRAIRRVGMGVVITVTASLALLITLSVVLIRVLHIQ